MESKTAEKIKEKSKIEDSATNLIFACRYIRLQFTKCTVWPRNVKLKWFHEVVFENQRCCSIIRITVGQCDKALLSWVNEKVTFAKVILYKLSFEQLIESFLNQFFCLFHSSFRRASNLRAQNFYRSYLVLIINFV